jgi:glyoxylase-like metal-dependent hydrolase (beta-lactamase superfamily II)/rhodanese-related sulfurtransferase
VVETSGLVIEAGLHFVDCTKYVYSKYLRRFKSRQRRAWICGICVAFSTSKDGPVTTSIILKQLFDSTSGTYTYLLFDEATRQALLIDCVYEQHERDLALIRELELDLLACLDTHCHADHVTGAWLVKNALRCDYMASRHSGIAPLDRGLVEGDEVRFGSRALAVIETPGHTDGCISLLLDDKSMVFTGDSLLIRGCGRTDFQQGSAHRLYHSIRHKLFALPDDCVVYPAHDYSGRMSSSIGEEKRLNPRIGGAANEEDFVGFMENMQLPHPKKLDIAVPANLQAGQPGNGQPPRQPDWAPVVTTYGGILKISPQWVAAHLQDVNILDVRTSHELAEESARIPNAQLIPINELRERVKEVRTDKPVMTLCRSGKRSVLAFTILREAGIERVANVDGGLLRWYEEGLPVT